MQAPPTTAPIRGAVYGAEPVPLDDPAEQYHEASKIDRWITGSIDPIAIEHWTNTDVERDWGLPIRRVPGARVHLPAPLPMIADLSTLLMARRSRPPRPNARITLAQLATLAWVAYGVQAPRTDAEHVTHRTVPSGGALYPLGLWCEVTGVAGLEPGTYQYDPFRHELTGPVADTSGLADLVPHRHLVDGIAVTFVISATFWRSRAKYGLRAYRFTLLEAGHVGQNLVLAAEALGLAANPVGGFYDRDVDEHLDLDGVNESVLYLVSVGQRS